MYDVVVLTDERYVNPSQKNDYVSNVLLEDKLVTEALEKHGLKVKKVAWSDPEFAWEETKYAIFRTTWDYIDRFDQFTDWLLSASLQTIFINSYDLISWNLDKHYLDDLKRKGVNVVESYFIEPQDKRSLIELHRELGWDHTVLKPSISASAKDTFWLNSDNIVDHESRYSDLIANESMLLQPFQKSVMERGEVSLMLIGGVYTHAVLKVAKPGDFRVQDDFGGSVHDYNPTREEKELAIRAVNTYNEVPAYARVDIIQDNEGKPAVSELEVIEPEMWFRKNPDAAQKLADYIVDKYSF